VEIFFSVVQRKALNPNDLSRFGSTAVPQPPESRLHRIGAPVRAAVDRFTEQRA